MDAAAYLALAGIWLFDALALAPLVLFGSTRRLFERGPTSNTVGNYLLGVSGYAVVHVLVAFAPGIVTGTVGLGWFAGATLGLPVVSWVVAAVVIPRVGWWDTAADDDGGWSVQAALGTVLFGYVGAIAALVLLTVVALFIVFAQYPG